MRKVLLFLAAFLMVPIVLAQGGFTTVTGTIKDPNGVAWACGTISAQLITAGGAAPTLNGVGFTTQTSPVQLGCPTVPGSGVSGSFTMRLADSGVISPANTTWKFTVNTTGNAPPLGTGPQSFSFTSAINCSTNTPATCTANAMDISASLNALAPALGGGISSVTALPATCTTGAQYNLTTSLPKGVYVCGQNNALYYVSPPFFSKYMGSAPEDFGAFGDVKWCFDGNITNGQTTFTSTAGNSAVSNTSLTGNVATYTVGATGFLSAGSNITVTGTTNGGGVFNVTNVPVKQVLNGTQFTVTIINANVGSAADTGTMAERCALFTVGDAGKVIDVPGAGAAGVTLHTTIQTFTNVTTVTLAASAGTTVTNGKFLYGHDDTTAVQNWATWVQNGNANNTQVNVHSGYLSKWYYITQPVRFVNPYGANGFSQSGLGGPEPFNAANATEGLSIWGTGSFNAGFAMAPQGTFNFNCPVADPNPNMGVVYYRWWNGITNANWGIVADSGSTYNTATCTGQVALYLGDLNGHDYSDGLLIEDAHNTNSTFTGDNISGNCFESHRRDFQIYNNDLNGTYGNGIAGGTGSTFEQCIFDGMIWEGWRGAYNIAFFDTEAGGNPGGTKIVNGRLIDSGVAGAGGELAFASSFVGSGTQDFIIENTSISSSVAGNYDIATNAAATGRLRLANVALSNTASSAATNLLLNSSANFTISHVGGQWSCSATCTNAISNATGSFIFAMDVQNVSGRAGLTGTGVTSIGIANQNAVAGSAGWTGQGLWGASLYATNTNCQLGGAAGTTSPAACGAAAAGMIAVPASQTTYTVNSTAVTANSEIRVQQMTDNSGLPSSPTCNAGSTAPIVASRVAGTSFTINLTSVASVTCFNYTIVN